MQVEDGVLSLRVDQCRVGSVRVPRWFVRPFCPLLNCVLSRDRRSKPLLDGVKRMTVEPNAVQVTYGPFKVPFELRRELLGPRIASEELLASLRTQVDHLLPLLYAGRSGGIQPSFDICLRTVFSLACDRSTHRSPVTENRAAILALGILLGHPAVEDFTGPILTDPDRDIAHDVLHQVVLCGRPDWTRHFCVSAAIVVLSDEAVSDAAGLLKEETDAEAGGSGFSFADLLADRAGTVFAVSATRDKAAARAMQDRLARRFQIEEVFPPAGNLPEGISDAELQSEYGGVGGERYRRFIEEIDRRIATCSAYQ